MGPATVQAVCGRGRDGVRTALTTPHTNARAVRPDVEDRILRLRKNLTKQGFDAGAETIAAPRRRPTTNVPAVSTVWRIPTVETAQAEISLSGSRW
jgi:hypothetical protein